MHDGTHKILGTKHPTGVRIAGALAGADCTRAGILGQGRLVLSLDTVNHHSVTTAFNLTFPVCKMS